MSKTWLEKLGMDDICKAADVYEDRWPGSNPEGTVIGGVVDGIPLMAFQASIMAKAGFVHEDERLGLVDEPDCVEGCDPGDCSCGGRKAT